MKIKITSNSQVDRIQETRTIEVELLEDTNTIKSILVDLFDILDRQ